MTTTEAASRLGKTPRWIRQQCKTGELRASFYGGSYNISDDAIDAYIHAHLKVTKKGRRERSDRRVG